MKDASTSSKIKFPLFPYISVCDQVEVRSTPPRDGLGPDLSSTSRRSPNHGGRRRIVGFQPPCKDEPSLVSLISLEWFYYLESAAHRMHVLFIYIYIYT